MLDIMKNKSAIDKIVKSTIDALFSTKGSAHINSFLKMSYTKEGNWKEIYLSR